MTDILVIAGSESDERVVKKTTEVLDALKIPYEVQFASAHREPDRVKEIVTNTEAKVIIAIAGLAAALPGAVASYTKKPVIGVPVAAALGGLDALLSMVQMPKGVPVATVGIENGQNAAYLAARILGVETPARTVPHSYAQAGVDTEEVSRSHRVLGDFVRKSFEGTSVMQDFGHYANTVKISDDVCISLTTDGVGSKMIIAEMLDKYDTIGQDCVAMNVNDLICVGATPVGFVDYIACEKPLPDSVLAQIGKSLLEGCRLAGIPILGGETAILPEMIRGHGRIGLDLAGTAVGAAHPSRLIDGSHIQSGDAILGIASSGLHSNGFTLARKVLLSKYALSDKLPWGPVLGEELLRPTRIYVPHFKALVNAGIEVRGLAHITGTGFTKVLRLKKARFVIEKLPEPHPVFTLIQSIAAVSNQEMFTTFNMGVGLVVVVPQSDKAAAMKTLQTMDKTYELGHVEPADSGSVVIRPYGVTIE